MTQDDFLRAINLDEVTTHTDETGMTIFHYRNCNPDSDFNLKQLRGVIVNASGDVVCRRVGYTPMYVVDDVDTDITSILGVDEDTVVAVSRAVEGAMVTIYAGDRLSTARRSDAYNSFWGSSKSFGELFDECFPNWRDEMAKLSEAERKYSYTFFITHPDIYYVAPNQLHMGPSVTHIATYDGMNLVECPPTLGVQTAEKFHMTVRDVMNFMHSEKVNRSQYHGIYVVVNGLTYKFIRADYHQRLQIRGNTPDIQGRYLDLRRNDSEMLRQFIEMFPDQWNIFADIEYQLDQIYGMLHWAYRQRYIKGNYLWLAEPANHVLREIHERHMTMQNDMGVREPITAEDIAEYVDFEVPIFDIYRPLNDSKRTKTLWHMAEFLGRESDVFA